MSSMLYVVAVVLGLLLSRAEVVQLVVDLDVPST